MMNKNIKILLIGQFLTLLGSNITQFSLVYWLYIKYGNAYNISLYNMSLIIPLIVMSPVSGFLIDKYNTKNLLYVSEIGEIISSSFIFIAFIYNIENIYIIVFANIITSLTESFSFPAYSVLVSYFTQQEKYRKIHGYYMLNMAIPSIIGPVIAPKFIKIFKFSGIMSFNIFTLIISIILIMKIESFKKPESLQEKKIVSSNFKDFFLKKEVIFILCTSAICIFIFNILKVLIPIFFITSDKKGNQLYSNIEFLIGVSSLLGSVYIMISKKIPKNLIQAFFFSVLGMSVLCLILGITTSLVIWYITIFLYVILNQIADANAQASWQSTISIENQGFVFSIRRAIIWSCGAIGADISGRFVDYMNNYDTIFRINLILKISSLVSIILLLLLYFIFRKIFNKQIEE